MFIIRVNTRRLKYVPILLYQNDFYMRVSIYV